MLAQERSGRLFCRRFTYCQYPHIFAKDTNVHVDNCSSMGAEGLGWQRYVQGSHRLLQQEQGEGRGDRVEQGACKPAEGVVAGNVTSANTQYRMVVVEEDMEAMHRTESV